jgi:multicomponent Na+:H+ antiporter subunit C
MGIAAFVLALTYRSYRLNTVEEVSDDPEDARVSQLAGTDGAPPEDDRPEPDLTRDTEAPDELDALPGLEGSR